MGDEVGLLVVHDGDSTGNVVCNVQNLTACKRKFPPRVPSTDEVKEGAALAFFHEEESFKLTSRCRRRWWLELGIVKGDDVGVLQCLEEADFFLDEGFVILVLDEDFFEDVTLGLVLGVGAGVDKGEATFSEKGAEVEAVHVVVIVVV